MRLPVGVFFFPVFKYNCKTKLYWLVSCEWPDNSLTNSFKLLDIKPCICWLAYCWTYRVQMLEYKQPYYSVQRNCSQSLLCGNCEVVVALPLLRVDPVLLSSTFCESEHSTWLLISNCVWSYKGTQHYTCANSKTCILITYWECSPSWMWLGGQC